MNKVTIRSLIQRITLRCGITHEMSAEDQRSAQFNIHPRRLIAVRI